MSQTIRVQAERISTNLVEQNPRGLGFIELLPVIMGFITGLIQMFKECKNPTPDPSPMEEARQQKEFVKARWNGRSGRYASPFFNKCVRRIKRDARKNRRHITDQEANTIVRTTLDDCRLSVSEEALARCCQEADALPLDLDD